MPNPMQGAIDGVVPAHRAGYREAYKPVGVIRRDLSIWLLVIVHIFADGVRCKASLERETTEQSQ
jgi:hypothetical protein